MFPETMFHGTDAISGLVAAKRGFEPQPPDYIVRATRTEPGYIYGAEVVEWAAAYARARARQWRQRFGIVLSIDLRGLDVQDDPTVALDGLPARALRVRTPVPAERVSVHAEVPV
jgi:hypothetical protein